MFFANVAIPEVQLIGILSCLPTLKCLSLLFYDTALLATYWRSFWQHLRECERPIDDTQSEGTSAADGCRNGVPVHLRICPRLEYLKVAMNDGTGLSLDDVAGFIVSRCSPTDYFRSSTSQLSGINSPILQEVSILHCDFTENDFLQYPGIDELLNNGLKLSYDSSHHLVATSDGTPIPPAASPALRGRFL